MAEFPRKILIVTYVFPPFAAVGVYRILKFCKYLLRWGLTPVILTPSNPNTLAYDEGLLNEVSPDLAVYRRWTFEPFRGRKTAPKADKKPDLPKEILSSPSALKPSLLARIKKTIRTNLSIPDGTYFWSWWGLLSGVRLIRKEKIDIIISSGPPQTVHLLASRLARLTGRPHIVDFRDLWTQNTSYAERNLSPRQKRRDARLERSVLRHAAAITVNTAMFKTQLLENNLFLSDHQIEVITNGVDPDDFKEFVSFSGPNEKFTVLYTGSLYGKHRSPGFFFAALKEWIRERPEIAGQMKVKFIGNWTEEHLGLISRYGLEQVVEKVDWMPQRKVLAETFAADLLLLFLGFDPVVGVAIPRKLFEYVITGKPIMAFAPPGESSDIINRYQCGVCFSEDAPKPIMAYLNKALKKWQTEQRSGSMRVATLRSMPEFEAAAQIKKLAELCHRLPDRGHVAMGKWRKFWEYLFSGQFGRLVQGVRERIPGFLYRYGKAHIFELEAGQYQKLIGSFPDGYIFRSAERDEMPACSRIAGLPTEEYYRRWDAGDLCYGVFANNIPANMTWVHRGSCYVRGLGYFHNGEPSDIYIYGIMTDPAARGKGLYKNALMQLAELLYKGGATRLIQLVEEGNAPVLKTLPDLGYMKTKTIRYLTLLGIRYTAVTDLVTGRVGRKLFLRHPQADYRI